MILQLPVYDASKAQLLSHGVKDGAGCHLAARCSRPQCFLHLGLILYFLSFLAGLSACIASNPVDVVRTRMMVQRKTARYRLLVPKNIIVFLPSRSSLGLPLHSSYGETIPHTYFTSSLRCGLHTVILILFTECPETF